MKRFKKVAVALLSSAILAAPLLTSCQPSNADDSSSATEARAKSIEITKLPTKVNYESGDVFDPTGMEVTATMNDGTKKVVTDYTYSKAALTTSDTRVKITYQGKVAYVNITVTFVKKATSISIEENPTKMTYVVGEKFDPTGMKVVGIMNDNTREVITDYDWDKKEALTISDTVITITYGNLKATLVIKVEEEKMSSIEITKKPTKLAYLVGEKFDKTGMEISGVTQAGKKTTIDIAKVVTDKDDVALTVEDKSVTVKYQDFEVVLKISVSVSKLVGIRVVSDTAKTTYWEGDDLNPEGLAIYAKYEDETERQLDLSEVDFDKTKVAKGDTDVTISYGGFSEKIAIVVKEKITTVTVDGLKTVRVEAEHLDTSKAALRQDFIDAGRTFIENGDGASNGQNICGYNPGSIFEIPVIADKDCEILVTSRMSDTELNYKINDGVEFKMDDTIMTAEDVTFEYKGVGDYWNWKDVKIGKISLKAGSHLFTLKSKNQRPNLDCFDFTVLKYGDQVAEKTLTELNITTAPTKTVYTAGETFDPTGMVVEGKYNDLTTEVITDYTIDKTGPLTEDDEKVTISYKGLTAEVKIQVGKKYTAKIKDTGTVIAEAEDLDFSDLILRSDMQQAGFTEYVIDNNSAHGGKSIERYATGSKLTLDINVGQTATTKFSVFAADTCNRGFDELVTVKLDDETITSNNPTLSSSAASTYYNWQEAIFTLEDLAAGDHKITLEFTGGVPNLDYFSFYTSKYGDKSIEKSAKSIRVATAPSKVDYMAGETFDPTGMVVEVVYDNGDVETITDYTYDKTAPLTVEDKIVTITYKEFTTTVAINVKSGLDFEITAVGERLEEAEDADWSNLKGDSLGVQAEDNSYSSGGKSIGHIASGGFIEYAFSVSEEMNLTVTTVIAKYEAVPASSLVSFKFDGTDMIFDDVTLGKTDGNDYFNFKDVVVNCGKVAAGNHTFRINLNGGNVDCFKFNFTK